MAKPKPIKQELRQLAKKAHKAPANLRFAILVTIGVFWADFLRRILADILPPELSAAISSLLAAIIVTIVGLAVLESWSRIRKYFK